MKVNGQGKSKLKVVSQLKSHKKSQVEVDGQV